MFPDANKDDALQVGLWLLRAALAAALIFLTLGGRARAADGEPGDAATRLLLEPELATDADRASEANELMVDDRNRKLAVISSALVDLGIHAAVGLAPLKLLQSAGDLGQGISDFTERTPAEEQALLLLAPGARSGILDADGQALFDRLEQRERKAQVERLLDEAQRSLAKSQVSRARFAVARALELAPGSERADALLDAIAATGRDSAVVGEAPGAAPVVAPWEVGVATALLTDADARAEQLAPSDDRDAELARATARYESGECAAALADLRELARGSDTAAAGARRILADPGVNPERAFDDELASYHSRRSLGYLGGSELADHGLALSPENLELSPAGYKAWKGSYKLWRRTVNPMNLVVDAPARFWRDWRPNGEALHEAAQRYLELEPNGERAAEAREWLANLAQDERAKATSTPFHDGYFMLPHARTRYARVAPGRVVVSLDALEKNAPELSRELGLDAAPAYTLGSQGVGEGAVALEPSRALELLGRIADGLEGNALRARGQTDAEALEAVRRLDGQIRAGTTLYAAPRLPQVAAGLGDMGLALVDGKQVRTYGDVALTRSGENVTLGRELGGGDSFCLAETPCIDQKLAVAGELYAHSNSGGSVGVGARADYREARLSVEMGLSGPHASLVLPLARWLGIANMVPVEAHLEVGLDGISAGPRIDDSIPPESAQSL